MDASFTAGERLSLGQLAEQFRDSTTNLLHHDPDGPAECLVRRGELVGTGQACERIVQRLGHLVDGVDAAEQAKLARIRLRSSERDQCVRIAADLGAEVAPNHVHVGSAVLFGTPVVFGTGATPERVTEPEPPPEECWEPPVNVAVLDTGLDPHPWFAGRPWFAEWGHTPETLDGDGVAGQDRQAGHGTFVAGVLLRHAPGVRIRHQRALASTGLSDDLRVAAALRAIRTAAAARGTQLDVLLLSAGCWTADDRCPPALASEIGTFTGATVVASAGNAASSRPFWPAALPEVVAVGATDADGHPAAFSGYGPWVDTTAPGVDVPSSYVKLTPDGLDGAQRREYGTAAWSGTSFAAPVVAARIATELYARRGNTLQTPGDCA